MTRILYYLTFELKIVFKETELFYLLLRIVCWNLNDPGGGGGGNVMTQFPKNTILHCKQIS